MQYYYYPVLFDLGLVKIYTWGLIVAIGVYLAYYFLKKSGCDEHCERLFFLSLVFGFGVLFLILYKLSKNKSFEGYLFSMYLILYGVGRFFSDFLRADPTYFGFTFAQYIAILSFGIGLIILFWKPFLK